MDHDSHATPSRLPALIGIGLVLIAYFGFVMVRGVESLPGGHQDSHASADAHESEAHESEAHGAEHDDHQEGGDAGHGDESVDAHGGHGAPPHWISVIPFVLLLCGIAILPLIPSTEHWWESNANRLIVALVLATATLLYYMFVYSGGGIGKVKSVLDHAILGEYIPFIVLLFSLYTISGGIRIQGDLVASPFTNTMFLLVGGALASFVGTTGAAMLLIRPLIETNNERTYRQHTVVFFIFVVCNCGGCLLPIGDPPLFLGYLKGVSFLWTMEYLWAPWLVANLLVLAIYYIWDRFFCYPREHVTDVAIDRATVTPLSIRGLMPNLLLLLGVVLSVALLAPTKPIMGWYPWPFLREIVQLALVFVSLSMGSAKLREENHFNYHAILEVAALFIGIFICMQPAIEILHEHGGSLPLTTARRLYWATGGLSSVLDNAPTYVVFYETAAADAKFAGAGDFAQLVSQPGDLADSARQLLMGISLGAVFMGAMTYIGNGPNFMVRAIAEEAGVKMPSFFGYVVRYSIPVLLPVFFVVSLIFL